MAYRSLIPGLSNGERHLLDHFLHVVARVLVVVDDGVNPFLHHLVPMAVSHQPVRHALTALSASHLANVYPDFRRDCFEHQSLALKGLKTALSLTDSISCALATTLILCLLEVHPPFIKSRLSSTDSFQRFTKAHRNAGYTIYKEPRP